jgi:uncharacterized protein (TIGR02117 family)
MAAALAALIVLALAACATPHDRLPRPGEPSRPVWLVGHGWHVGLAVRRADVRPDVWREAHDLGGLEHVEVGWGDGEFYPAARGTVGMALKAAVRSASSVLHVAAFDGPVEAFFAESPVIELRLSPGGFDALCRFISAAYARDPAGRPLPPAPGLYGAGRFYLARTRYHALDNSNQWAAQALRAGGVPVAPPLSLTSGSVLAQAARVGTVVRATWPVDAGPAGR